jgi:hypothetical protein
MQLSAVRRVLSRHTAALALVGAGLCAAACHDRVINVQVGGGDQSFAVTQTIGQSGGDLTVNDPANPVYGTEVIVPPDAVSQNTDLTVSPAAPAPAAPFGTRVVGPVVDVQFPVIAAAATVYLPFRIDAAPGERLVVLLNPTNGQQPGTPTLTITGLSTGSWVAFSPTPAPDGSRRLMVNTDTFGQLVVVAIKVTVAGGAQDGGADMPVSLQDAGANTDHMPPVFAGLKSASLDPTNTMAQLMWDPATDDVSSQAAIRYRLYLPSFATVGVLAGETPPGATSLTVPVTAGVRYYFIVRAVDEAGNEDSNLVVRALQVPSGHVQDGGPDLPDVAPPDVPIDQPPPPDAVTADATPPPPDLPPPDMPTCFNGLMLCNGTCVDIRNDFNNCGGCNAPCQTGQVCSDTQCAAACGGNTPDLCNGICTNVQSDPYNCSQCSIYCGQFGVCTAGNCQAVAGPQVTCTDTERFTTPGAVESYSAQATAGDRPLQATYWTVTERAAASTAQPSPLDQATTTFTADKAGDYALTFTAVATDGQQASCTTQVQAVGAAGLRVYASWVGAPDMDLHLLHPTATMWFDTTTNLDCFYENCVGTSPEWGLPGSFDNPRLDRDDTDGLGPENINLDAPQFGGAYRIGVHHYTSGDSPTDVIVRIYCRGTLAMMLERTITGSSVDNTRDFWKVADVVFPGGGQPCQVTPLDEVDPSNGTPFPR